MDAGLIIFYVFLVGGAFSVVERTGALGRLVNSHGPRALRARPLVIPLAGLAFATGRHADPDGRGADRVRPRPPPPHPAPWLPALVAVAMSLGASLVGASFSPINPFQVGIAQKVADLELASGWQFRMAFLVPAVAIWLGGHHAVRQTHPDRAGGRRRRTRARRRLAPRGRPRLVLAAFVVFVVGVMQYGWDFDRLGAGLLHHGRASPA